MTLQDNCSNYNKRLGKKIGSIFGMGKLHIFMYHFPSSLAFTHSQPFYVKVSCTLWQYIMKDQRIDLLMHFNPVLCRKCCGTAPSAGVLS